MKTFVINLERSTVRKQYMQDLLSNIEYLDIEFIKAIDGRLLTDDEKHSLFDYDKCMSLYGRELNEGELGCLLSHRKACEALMSTNEPYALVLEDDITIIRDLHTLDLARIDVFMKDRKPKVLMLSGDYWYFRKKDIVKVYSAIGTYSYIVNRSAAEIILSINPPCCTADDWLFYKRHGVHLYAKYPYMIDANMNMGLLGSDVLQDNWSINRSKMSFKEIVFSYYSGFIKRLLKMIHHFEHKVRVIDNVVV